MGRGANAGQARLYQPHHRSRLQRLPSYYDRGFLPSVRKPCPQNGASIPASVSPPTPGLLCALVCRADITSRAEALGGKDTSLPRVSGTGRHSKRKSEQVLSQLICHSLVKKPSI